jgi:HlyD family secretion protein
MNRGAASLLLLIPAVGVGYAYAVHEPPPAYLTAAAERGHVASIVKANGTVEAVVSVDVSSQLSGRLAEVFVDFNDTVKAGQPLARLDQEIFIARVNETRAALLVARAERELQRAAVQRAKVAIENAGTARAIAEAQATEVQARQDEAEREYQRQSHLARAGVASVRELGQARSVRDAGAAELGASVQQVELKAQAIAMAEAELRMAEANVQNAEAVTQQRQAELDQAELDLARTVLRAPVDGVIIKRDINPGQTVAVSLDAKTLFTIAGDLRSMSVHGKIDEADIGQVQVGQTAEFTVDAYPDKTFAGRVLQIRKAPEVVQNLVTYTAIISAPNPDLLLYPGMTALLRIVVRDSGEILTIPNEALRFHPPGMAGPTDAKAGDTPPSGPGESATVWVADNLGRPEPVAVMLGASDDRRTELRGGSITADQRLIVGTTSSRANFGPWSINLRF